MTKIINHLSLCLAAFLLTAGCSLASAHDFTVTTEGHKLYFNITDSKNHTVEVTYQGSIADKRPCTLTGKVEIPSQVKHEQQTYTVTAIGAKAFWGAEKLESILIPTGIKKIGDFAFEGCLSLQNILFPANSVVFGQGVFFKCRAIKDVTLGSDWTQTDLAMFRWSEQLQHLYIPAKVTKIKNMKKLRHLKSVDIDSNNTHFQSQRGMLYSKDGKTLYDCPRAYKGMVLVAQGTETVVSGALADCLNITAIDLPASLKNFSFRETARLTRLEVVNLRAAQPLITAYDAKGHGVFALQVASNSDVEINVFKDSKRRYKNAIVNEPGEYTETRDAKAVTYTLKDGQLLDSHSINGVRDFD